MDLQYSGYPGDAFPQQCGAGYGYGGFGQYGTYGDAAGSNPGADQIDYDVAGRCGGDASIPEMPSCGPVAPQPPANRCGAPETFAPIGPNGPSGVGCGMGDLWADKTCRLPPNHCGSQRCNDPQMPSGCGAGVAGPAVQLMMAPPNVEHYVGDLGDAGRFSGYAADEQPGSSCGASVADGCDSALQIQRDPGYGGLRCSMPYSAPYHAGPNACVPSSEIPMAAPMMQGPMMAVAHPAQPHFQMPHLPQLPHLQMPSFIAQFQAPGISLPGLPRISFFNLIIAAIIAYLVYRYFVKKR